LFVCETGGRMLGCAGLFLFSGCGVLPLSYLIDKKTKEPLILHEKPVASQRSRGGSNKSHCESELSMLSCGGAA
jgi:hypothetical protein